MAGSYDGSIRIDTSINSQPIDNGISAIENKIKSIGTAIGLAFGVKELVDFGKRAVTAASDLAEAQNVVDTAFGDMSWKMEQFAATALDTYGISELTAKNMGSTYMAMAKGMGVATDSASDMAVTLTGRLSDIMSFYNKTQSEVDTIGRALITGETEPLKAIGVVMTQTNLSAYAMAQGFAKTYEEMSSNEQLLVRYKYFLEQTAMAQGDFAKTSEGWANQTRLLSERWNEFITNFGGLIMNTLTPALEFANEAVSFLNELFFGGKDNAENTSAVKNAEAVTDEVTSMGAAADKSKKKLNNLIAGFDELHIISGAGSDKEKEQTTDAGIDTSNLLGVNLDADTKTAKKAAGKYRDVINEIYLAFKRHPLTKTVEGIIKGVGKFFGFIKDNNKISAGNIVDTLMDILGAILAYKAVKGIVGGVSTFAKGFGGLIGIITAHPVAAAVVGIVGLAVGIYKLSEELERQRIASNFGDITISIEELSELVDPIAEDANKVANAFDDNKQKLKDAKENFSKLATAVEETAQSFHNQNLPQDVEGFAQQLDDFVESALNLNSATYDTSDLKALFMTDGVIDDEEQKILDELSDLGGEVADKIKSYGEEIHKITQAAIDENRELTESEIKNLEELYQKLAEMTAQQNDIKSTATWERLKNGDYTYDSYAELAERIKEAQEQDKKARDEIEQSNYEKIVSVAASMKANGKSDAEIDAFKNKEMKKVEESLKEMEIKSQRYQREIILAYAQGTFTNMSKAFTHDPEELKKMQEYFDLLLTMPDEVSENQIFSMVELDPRSVDLINHVRYLLKDGIEDQFGLDLMGQLEELDAAIGDSVYSLDDYYNALEATISDFTGLDVDDILPTFEELKATPEAFTDFLNSWASEQQAKISLGLELDTTEADKQLDNYKKNASEISLQPTLPGAQTYNLSPYVSPQYYPTNTQDPKVTLSLYLNDEFKDTYTMGGAAGTAAAVSVPLRDINVDNGKSWGR